MTKRCAPSHIANGSYVSIDVATEHPPALSISHVSGWLAELPDPGAMEILTSTVPWSVY